MQLYGPYLFSIIKVTDFNLDNHPLEVAVLIQ